ncbi:hypothetical protein V6N12_058637 [Hibiscus sabdariffa]|uniref:Uncharacterized protein n=1 Tax=Hibiscus sabdariffa TaxID=183260 RepID=A0ABR2ESQ0_9ROSI
MVRHPEENQPNSSTRVAATRKVIHVPSVLQSDNDVAVRVVEDGSSREFLENNGRPLYGPIRSMYLSKSLVTDEILGKSNVPPNFTSPGAHVENEVQWIENSTFEGDV